MSKMSKAIAVLGVVAGLGVAALPLSSYAADYSQATNSQVQVEVGGAISIAIEDANGTSGAALDAAGITAAKADKALPYYENGTLDLGLIKVNGDTREGSIAVVVSSNESETYNLTIRSLNDYNALRSAEGATISAGTPAKGTSAWGWKGGDVSAWTAVPTSAQAAANVVTGASTSPITPAPTDPNAYTNNNRTVVTFGVSADANQAAGTYQNSVVFTATVANS